MRTKLGIVILAVQVAAFLFVHFRPPPGDQSWARSILYGCSAQPVGCTRYFAWAPNDYYVTYHLDVSEDGEALSPSEVEDRLRLAEDGVYEAPIQQLIDTLRTYEADSGSGATRIELRYRINGRDEQEWRD